MKLRQVNPWLNLVGNLAILLGLVAVAIEIRNNSAAVRLQALSVLSEQTTQLNLAASEPGFARLYVKSLETPHEMTAQEVWGLTNYMSTRLGRVLWSYDAYRSGVLSEEDWQMEASVTPIWFNTQFGRLAWDSLRSDFLDVPEVMQAIDNALADPKFMANDEFLTGLQERLNRTRSGPE